MCLSLQENKMASVTENCSKFQVSVIVGFLQAEGVREIHCRLVSVHSPNVFRQKEVYCAVQQI
jgi:hypothetical protein